MWQTFITALRKALPTKWELLFLAFVAVYNTVFSLNPWRTLLFWLLVPLVFCLLVFVITWLPEKVDSRGFALFIATLLVVSLAWTIYQNGGINLSGWRTFRLTLPFLVSTTSAALVTYLFLYAYNQHQFWAELFSLAFILLTQSRGPTLGLAMAILYGGVNIYWFVALTAFIIYAIPYTLREVIGPYSFYTQRFHIWKAAWDMFLMRPFSGMGFGCFPLGLEVYAHPFLMQFLPFNHAHDILLQLLSEMGIAGPVVFIILLRSVIKLFPPADTSKGRFLRMALVAYLGRNIFDVTP
jgi:hypothetical protein